MSDPSPYATGNRRAKKGCCVNNVFGWLCVRVRVCVHTRKTVTESKNDTKLYC